MNRRILLDTSVAFLVFLTASSNVLAESVVPPHLNVNALKHDATQINIPTIRSYSPKIGYALDTKSLSYRLQDISTPREAIDRLQGQIEQMILDDALDADFGNELLTDLDHVFDHLDDNVNTETSMVHLEEIQDDVEEAIDGGDVDRGDGTFIVNEIESVKVLLRG